ncbi:hypothetical protein ACFCY9_08050 [Streptomyces fimicarius]|uniref:hypothetical protein n=1 Tax=Streptomyces griseus TaxID=1911 RepID=UPI0035DADCCE
MSREVPASARRITDALLEEHGRLAEVARGRDRAAFAAALVRAALDPEIAGTVRETARARK